MTCSAGVAAGYYALKPGTQYIELGGKAIPIAGLKGTAERGFFYLNNGPVGYVIKTRQETQRESYEASRPKQAEVSQPMGQPSLPRPVVSSFDPGMDIFNDWK